jgi:hypothetical protein
MRGEVGRGGRDAAVSEIIATLLLVAMSIVFFAFAAFQLQALPPPGESVDADLQVSTNSQDQLVVANLGGEPISLKTLSVRLNSLSCSLRNYTASVPDGTSQDIGNIDDADMLRTGSRVATTCIGSQGGSLIVTGGDGNKRGVIVNTVLLGAPCNNGLDDDGDGKIDYAPGTGDPGCQSARDASERGTAICDNGADDDSDGRTDYNTNAALSDPGCASPSDSDPAHPEKKTGGPECDNDQDDNGDGKVDYNVNPGASDASCTGPTDPTEESECSNGVDDADGDTLVDLADPGCANAADVSELGAVECDNGIDDDADGKTDFNPTPGAGDPDCDDPLDDSEGPPLPRCNDGIDNDVDGKIDFPADPGCDDANDVSEKVPLGQSPQCDNNSDDDGDGKIDYNTAPLGNGDEGCEDPFDDNESTACSNGIDDDQDGLTDYAADTGCFGLADSDERGAIVCDDGDDNDLDGKHDYNINAGVGDAQCSSAGDTTEVAACGDGADNDGDGKTDYGAGNDPGCTDTNTDDSERGAPGVAPECDDTSDNDGDTKTDYPDDPGCTGADDTNELATGGGAKKCDNGADDDGDTKIDYPDDPGCTDPADPTENSA